MRRRVALLGLLCVAGCASTDDVAEPAFSPAEAAAVAPVAVDEPVSDARLIATLALQNTTLRIVSTPAGLRFHVYAGVSSAENLDEAALAARFPEVHRLYDSAIARGAYLDARLDARETRTLADDAF